VPAALDTDSEWPPQAARSLIAQTLREKKMNAFMTWKVLAVALVVSVGMAAPASSGAKKEVRGMEVPTNKTDCEKAGMKWDDKANTCAKK
jgi:hypothetical protein